MLTHIDRYHSPACLKTVARCRKECAAQHSKLAKLAAVKDQHRIKTVGFGRKDLHSPWSKADKDHLPAYLRDCLLNTMIPK